MDFSLATATYMYKVIHYYLKYVHMYTRNRSKELINRSKRYTDIEMKRSINDSDQHKIFC